MKTFNITVTAYCTVKIDESLLPDKNWKDSFYSLDTLEDVAKHIAYNKVANNLSLSRLDGFADKDDSLATVRIDDWEVEVDD